MSSIMSVDDPIDAVRRFNRFYTRQIGALNEGLLDSSFSLTEMRVLYELFHRRTCTAAELSRDIGLDPGYLSRILRNFRERGLVGSTPSERDGRRNVLALTEHGKAVFAPFEQRSRDEVAAMLAPLSADERDRVLQAMQTIQSLLAPSPAPAPVLVLRDHRPGDLGWVIHRHAALYHAEYGWDGSFEAMVADVAAEFIRGFDAATDRSWIAERDGAIVGSVFVVRQSDAVAKLRLLYVEPETRGLGLGRRLVDEAIAFARGRGYRRLTLWTNDILLSARRIYEAAGFRLEASEAHRSFGKDLVGETWVLDL